MFLVGLAVCGFLGAAIGASKGQALQGGLLGLLLGPIGVIIALVSGATNVRPCPHCKSKIAFDATACAHCQRDVPALAKPPSSGGNVVLVGLAVLAFGLFTYACMAG